MPFQTPYLQDKKHLCDLDCLEADITVYVSLKVSTALPFFFFQSVFMLCLKIFACFWKLEFHSPPCICVLEMEVFAL